MGDETVRRAGRGRWRKAVAVLRWTWIVVLLVLLVAGIVFRIPWRIAVLDSIFLLGATAVPRGYRRYFWGGVGLTVLALAGWVFWPDESQGWRPYIFEKETGAFLAKYRVPDAENAASIYEELSRRWGAEDANEPNVPYDWYDRAKKGPWRSQDHPEVAAWLDYHESIVRRLVLATGFERCFFEDDIRNELIHPPGKLPPVAEMRQLAFLLGAAANREWGEHGLDAATTKQVALLRFGVHLASQPENIFVLVGTATEAVALSQLDRAMIDGGADRTYLDRVDREVTDIAADWRSSLGAMLEYDRLQMKNGPAALMYQVNEAGRVRYSRDPWAAMRDQMQVALKNADANDPEALRSLNQMVNPGYWQKKAVKVGIIVAWMVIPSTPKKMGRAIDKAYEKYAPMFDATQEDSGDPQSPVSMVRDSDLSRCNWDFTYFARVTASFQEEAFYRLHTILRRAETTRRGTRVIVALRRYKNERGSWPQELEAVRAYGQDVPLTDSWGRPFVYKPQGDGFVLYSTGENRADENGERRTEYDEETFTTTVLADDVMIWPDRKDRE